MNTNSAPDVFLDFKTKSWSFRLTPHTVVTGFKSREDAEAELKLESYEVDRNVAIKRIRDALKKRSGKAWSVTGGTGTAWGWITISAPPRRRVNDLMTDEDREELGRLLSMDCAAHCQGVSIAAGNDYRREYVARAEGRLPNFYGKPYWD